MIAFNRIFIRKTGVYVSTSFKQFVTRNILLWYSYRICFVSAIIHYLFGLYIERSVPPARVSRLVTAIYDTPGMCGRGHCIVKEATRVVLLTFYVGLTYRRFCRRAIFSAHLPRDNRSSLLKSCQWTCANNLINFYRKKSKILIWKMNDFLSPRYYTKIIIFLLSDFLITFI